MTVKKVYLQGDSIVVVIEGREEYHMVFNLQTIPNVDKLIQLILTKVTEIDEGPHTPPITDWTPFFETLKTAIEGTDIGD